MALTFPEIDRVAFSIGDINVYWYGMVYVLGMVGAFFYVKLLSIKLMKAHPHDEKYHMTFNKFTDFAAVFGLGIIVGGRLGHFLFYDFDLFMNNPIIILELWTGGMSIYGAILGMLAAVYIYSKVTKVKLHIGFAFDYATAWASLIIFFGRIANFINGELYGRVASSDLPWAMVFPHVDNLPRHPSQIYEAIGEGLVIFIILNFLIWIKPKITNMPRGGIACIGAVLYGFIRFFMEFFREPAIYFPIQIGPIDGGISMSQIFSLIAFVAGVIACVYCWKNWKRSNPHP